MMKSSTSSNRKRNFNDSEINRCLVDFRKGRKSRKELLRVIEKHKTEFFTEDPQDGNLLHDLIRRGHTKSLLQVILPNHPDAVLAIERDDFSGQPVSLLRRAVERKDRAVVDCIVKAIAKTLEAAHDDSPDRREGIYEILLRLDDWRLAFYEYPNLLEDPAVRALFDLQPSIQSVLSDDMDFRAQMAHGETKILGSHTAFPVGFWSHSVKKTKLTLFSREGLRVMYQPDRTHSTTSPRNGDGLTPMSYTPWSSPLSPTNAAGGLHHDHADMSTIYHEITETSGVEVEASLIAFPAPLRSGDNSLLKLCCDLYERTGKTWLFELDAVSVILGFKWNAFGRPIYKLLLTISLLLAINYSLSSAYIMPLLQSDILWQQRVAIAWQAVILVNAFPLVIQEYWQWHTQGFGGYVSEAWNVLDMCTLSLVYFSTILRFFQPFLQTLYYLMSAVASLLLWFKLVAYLRGFKETGPLVRMIWQIVIDTRFFLLVLAISVIGFGNCLYMIFQLDIDREDAAGMESPIRGSYGTLFHTFLVLFAALNSNLDYSPFNASQFRVLSSLVYIVYCICTTIILLNLLIALMGDSYDRVQENAVAQGRYEQALSILEIESMLPRSILEDHRFFPRWVQVLRPKAILGIEVPEADQWSNRSQQTVSPTYLPTYLPTYPPTYLPRWVQVLRPKAILGMEVPEADQWSGRLRQIYKKIEISEKRLSHEIDGVGTQLEHLERRMGLPPIPLATDCDGNGSGTPTHESHASLDFQPGLPPHASGHTNGNGGTPTHHEGGEGGGEGAQALSRNNSTGSVEEAGGVGIVHFLRGGGGGGLSSSEQGGVGVPVVSRSSSRSVTVRLAKLEDAVNGVEGKLDEILRRLDSLGSGSGRGGER